MSLRERIGHWLLGKSAQERGWHPPIHLAQSAAPVFGPGLATQPAGATLLRENLGVADMATRAIANRLASLELEVVVQRRRVKGTVDEEILDDHPLALLLAMPHPDFTRAQLLRLTGQYMVTLGQAYWLKTANGLRVPARLTPLYPHKLVPIVSHDVIQGYVLSDENGAQIEIAADEIVAFRLPDPENVFSGEGYLAPNATATDTIRFQTEHIRSLYQSNAIPPALLKATADAPPPTPEQLDRFNADWIRRYHHRNGSSAGLPGWLPPGFDVIFAQMQTGADITPLLDYFDRQQLRNFGVPRSVLGEVVSGDRSSAETNQYVMDLHTVTPLAQIIADALSQQLASEFDPKLKVRFKSFVSDDKAHDLAKLQTEVSLKVRSINEVREMAGEDPVEWGEYPVGSFADVPYTGEEREPLGGFGDPSAIEDDTDDSESDEEEQELDDEPRQRDAEKSALSPTYAIAQRERWVSQYGSAMKRRWQQIFREQQRSVQAKLDALTPRSRVSAEDLFLVQDWITEALSRLVPIYVALEQEVGQHTYESLGMETEFIFTTAARKRIERHAVELVTQVNQTTKRRIAKALSDGVAEGESIAKMAKRLDVVFGRRRRDTKTIARTEVGTGATRASIDAVKQSGSRRLKRWITARDAKTPVRDDHVEMEGVTVELDELFSLPDGSRGEGPSDPMLAAGERINCRCTLIYPRAPK